MIHYHRDGVNRFLNLFRIRGSVFPVAFCISVPAAILTGLLSALIWSFDLIPYLQQDGVIMGNTAVWGGFNFLLGFLVVFRTSESYNRFWQGCTSVHKMGTEWFDCCAALMAFCKHSTTEEEEIYQFQNTMVRLFSMLHAAALAEVEDTRRAGTAENFALRMELIDCERLDKASIRALRKASNKVELIFQWIQGLIVTNIKTNVLSIPPPILTRSFQELGSGMVHFNDALMIDKVPFPFPYAVTCDCLLALHLMLTPVVVSQWCTHFPWAVIFAFIQVFTLWALNLTAMELENPFGNDANDIDSELLHNDMNAKLRALISADMIHTPRSEPREGEKQRDLAARVKKRSMQRAASFVQIWETIDDDDFQEPLPPLVVEDKPREKPVVSAGPLVGKWEVYEQSTQLPPEEQAPGDDCPARAEEPQTEDTCTTRERRADSEEAGQVKSEGVSAAAVPSQLATPGPGGHSPGFAAAEQEGLRSAEGPAPRKRGRGFHEESG